MVVGVRLAVPFVQITFTPEGGRAALSTRMVGDSRGLRIAKTFAIAAQARQGRQIVAHGDSHGKSAQAKGGAPAGATEMIEHDSVAR